MSYNKDDLYLATGHINARIDGVIEQTNTAIKDLSGKLTAVAEHSAVTEQRIEKIAPQLGLLMNGSIEKLGELVQRTLGMAEAYGAQQYGAILDRLREIEDRHDALAESVRYATEQMRVRHVKFNALVARVAELEAMRAEIEDERAAMKGEPAAQYQQALKAQQDSGTMARQPVTENVRVVRAIRQTLPDGYEIKVKYADDQDLFAWQLGKSQGSGFQFKSFSAAVDDARRHAGIDEPTNAGCLTREENAATMAHDAAIMTAPDDDMPDMRGYFDVTDTYGRPFHVALSVAELNEAIGLLHRAQLYLPACDTKREILAWLRKNDPQSGV